MVEEVKNGVISMFKDNYANFSGRIGKREYWLTILGIFILNIAVSIVANILNSIGDGIGGIVSAVWSLGTMIPLLALDVRRLHDTNKSGWYILICLVPLVGFILLLLQLIKDSVNEGNNY